MTRRLLLVVDGVLLVAAAFLGVRLYEAWQVRAPGASLESSAAAPSEPPPPTAAPSPEPPLTTYATVAERNLFSPNRTETAPEPPKTAAGPAAPAAPPAPKPKLYGVVLLPEGRGRAYLEDAQRKRIFAYSVGDVVGDARLEQIKADRVVLRRGSESFEVLLYDPSKPRQPGPPAGVQSPEAGGVGRPVPGRVPVPGPVPAPGVPPGVRAPVRPRVAVPPPAAPPSGESPEPQPTEEE